MDHIWRLAKEPWNGRDAPCVTMFTWTCDGCGTQVVTSTDNANVGSHGAHAFIPSLARLSKAGVLRDCREQLVKEVLEG